MGTKRFLSDQQELGISLAKQTKIEECGWTGVNERTFIAVKPDGVHRRLVGEIIRRFERKGFQLVGLKLMQAKDGLLREHYWDLREKNVIHGSDSVESAQREISLWFRQNELTCWEDSSKHWIYK
ncbi:hypothetical protein JZ751_015148 [Albula glossodonta]|uniref:Nucleoside diphosphate kinase n=1 Tax=Albula glossodonta TaxID=121402 RepID=A0A8T2NZV7_9TELE|nr:hypothetical protein JZ751_015148 [Albula glossodonta]